MKIVSLKALNINSLKGKTEINFQKLTQNSSLFAITGTTGSGKSTLLDIISCALYGRTARLKNPNDLMSRHSGEAYCEVEFEIKGHSYRSSWSQKRARKKHDGKFQTPKMELIDLEQNKIFPLKSKEVSKKVEELSGLDFGRFTQSMLLAQGSFDAFLKADEKERSGLLEKITGTQIYADVSVAIFNKYRSSTAELESEKKVLESIEFLDLEVVEEKSNHLKYLVEQKERTEKQLKSISQDLNWLFKRHSLREEREKNREIFLTIKEEKERKKSSFKRVELATKALNVWATYKRHEELEKSIDIDKKASIKLQVDSLQNQKSIELKQQNYFSLKKEFDTSTEIFENENQKLKTARELQTQEKEKYKSRLEAEVTYKNKRKTEDKIEKSLFLLNQNLQLLQEDKGEKEGYLYHHKKDKNLLENLALIKESISNFHEEQKSLQNCKKNLESSVVSVAFAKEKYISMKGQQKKLLTLLEDKEKLYSKYKDSPFNSNDIDEKIHKSLYLTQEILCKYKEMQELMQQKEKEHTEHKNSSKLLKTFIETKKALQAHTSEIQKHIETLYDKQRAEVLLQKYEQDREKLVEGKECFLCGSKKHPYVNESIIIKEDATQKVIEEHLDELKSKDKEIEKIISQIATTQNREKNADQELQKIAKSLKNIEEFFKEHSFTPSSESESLLYKKEAEFLKEQQDLKYFREQKEHSLQAKEHIAKELQESERLTNEINLTLQKALTEQEGLKEQTREIEGHLELLSQTIKSKFREFEVTFDKEQLSSSLALLQKRKEKYESVLKELNVLANTESKLLLELTKSKTEHSATVQESKNLFKQIEELHKDELTLAKQRVESLNVADLDIYEKEITQTYKSLQLKEQEIRRELEKLQVLHKERLLYKEELEEKVKRNLEKLKELSIELTSLYKQYDFKNTDALLNAMLLKDERELLQKECKVIEDKYTKTDALMQESINKLKLCEQEAQSDKTLEELHILQALLEQKIDEVVQSIGSLKKELELNKKNSEKFHNKMLILKEKEEDLKVWVKLNELVGSADGTKFKKFAQGITLDQLIHLANEHLKILSSRYTLARNQEKLLELEVVDAYQANVVRPVGTLSGGESFIVSLALALGLSELASQKISIDSLFLDEGFGTLDEESLETALDALNLLQCGGKMVGVISHVEALKERIPLQIRVVSRGDGTSYVEVQND